MNCHSTGSSTAPVAPLAKTSGVGEKPRVQEAKAAPAERPTSAEAYTKSLLENGKRQEDALGTRSWVA